MSRPLPKDQSYLIVSNHHSYVDILILSSLVNTLYVTSEEMRETKGLGFLAEIGGCLFVERRHKQRIEQEVSELRTALQQGCNVTVFPEATSSVGLSVLPFKNSLFSSVEQTTIPVQPLCLKYLSVGKHNLIGEKRTQIRDLIHWYGDMTFVDHLWNLCQEGRAEIEISVLESYNHSPVLNRKELAAKAYELINNRYESNRINDFV